MDQPATGSPAGRAGWARHTVRLSVGAAYVLAWAALALVAAAGIFFEGDRTTTLASHDAVLRPDLGGHVVVETGPVLPDLRVPAGSPIGVRITLGKTDAVSTEALVRRYAVIASQPEGQIARVRDEVVGMAWDAAVRGAVLGLVPILVWTVVGAERRRQLVAQVPTRQGALAGTLVVLLGIGLWTPWQPDPDTLDADREWTPLADFLGPEVPLPDGVADVEVRGDVTTRQTRRLVESAVDTYDKSKGFYAAATQAAARLDLRRPRKDETVVVLVSDRHDNVGMDAVARAIGDAAGATAVFDAGDDTSAGQPWEAFSLDSVTAAFEDLDRWGVAGNHDHGDFVREHLADRGWTMLDGQVVEGPGGSRLLGVDDPRSSGLGSWRDETGLSFEEVGSRLADVACAAHDDGDRVGTLLVHDANLGREALARGCVDLVVGGHVHVASGPDRVDGTNGQAGYTYTTGTTGGAAYAIALGSKPRRPAQVSVLTYRDGRPRGVQAVVLQSTGRFDVGPFRPLSLSAVP